MVSRRVQEGRLVNPQQAREQGRYVVLRGGLIVPIEPLLLLLDLERRGCRVFRDRTDVFVLPAELLRDDDKRAFRAWKPELLALLAAFFAESDAAH